MRRDIVHEGATNLKYEIREIVGVAREVRGLGQPVTWENIGDPIEKGEVLAPWIRDILHELLDQPRSFGYCDTAGVPDTRAFLADLVNQREGGAQITPEDLLFFNGVGDAVARVYGFLKREARILGPSPAYSTHSSAEGAHSGYSHVTYDLDPHNGWMPNVDDIRNKVKYNDAIAGILLLSPDNPTGAV
ncbi:MAG TPA: aminotransferase class I/II-fold pyridoxal phosphate-dependent enzyme, partial [Candidatus Hydrogenedentes bacterium]|nr:aminotransferase class I/II-fold pyridoxal phosphate-dependent enzyme [Candidatus Hydrogenedentota bacterium]